MKSIITTLILGSFLFFSSCVKEDLSGYGNAPEGQPALVRLNMNMAMMGSNPTTKAMTPEQESEVKNIRIMIFDRNGTIVTNKIFTGSSTSLSVNTYSGNNRSIYIVANAVPAADAKLRGITTLTEFKEAKTTYTELDLESDNALMMIGAVEGVNIQPGSGSLTIPIQLDFLVAKLTLNVVDATNPSESITLVGWNMVDVPINTFIYQGANKKDANHGLENTEAAWFNSNVLHPFKNDSLQVYLTENRRGERVNRSIPTNNSDRYPNMDLRDRNHRGKKWYKPARATAIFIRAIHKNATITKRIEMWIYLGADNHSNYDVIRGNHYKFTVTVNGLNDIQIDSNVENAINDFTVTHGTSLVMDTHPDFRPFLITAPKGKATIEILDENGRAYDDPGFNAAWLKISPLDLMRHQVKQSAPNNTWQQNAGAPRTFVRAKYIPHKSVRAALSGKGGWNAIPVGEEDDDVMTFEKATYRMCYKITDIPFTNTTGTEQKTLSVYADEYLNDGGERKATVRITYTKDGYSSPLAEAYEYTISQKGYLRIYENSLDAGLAVLKEDGTIEVGPKKRFVLEQIQEMGLPFYPKDVLRPIDLGYYYTQWGLHGTYLYDKEDKYRNGTLLTANAVYTDVNRIDNEPTGFGNYYRAMYGKYNSIPTYTASTSAPYYYPHMVNYFTDIYHPIYNSSVARYCHEKNRDMNGDGIIDASETKWYLPSQHELMMLYITGALNTNDAHWSSTEFSNADAWAINLHYGVSFVEKKSSFRRAMVCVRVL